MVSALNQGSPDRGYGPWEPGLDENGPPHWVRMTARGEGPGTVQVTARVIQPLGADILVFFELGGREADVVFHPERCVSVTLFIGTACLLSF